MREKYGAFHAAVHMLYEGETLQLAADEDAPSVDPSVFDAVADLIFKAGGFDINQVKDPAARKLMRETANAINRGVDAHLPTDVPDTLRYALEENGFIFSGFKTFHAMREIGLSLVNDKGEIKSYSDFQADVLKLNAKYNTNYLYAEYKHAIGTCQMAAKWQKIEEDGDRYLLQYRTAQDERVREEHALMDGITLPPSDPFWDKYYPPNGWGCRCTAVQVRRGKYTESDPAKAMMIGDNSTAALKQQIFRFNAGKTMQLFPPKHPYFKAPKEAKKVVNEVVQEESEQQRKERYKAELPTYLTEAEREAIAQNCVDIEAAFGVQKGKAMDYDAANKGKENPQFSKGGGYYVNCQTCTVTHWLRRLGFDLEAKPNVNKSAYNEMDAQGITWEERFLNIDGKKIDYDYTYRWQVRKGYKSMTATRLKEYFKEKFSADGVYEIYCAWKGGNAHVFLADVSGGKVRYFDPQSGEDNVSRYIASMKPSRVGVIRIDDKIINPKLKNLFIKKTK